MRLKCWSVYWKNEAAIISPEVGLWSILITVRSWKKILTNIYLRVDFETLYSRIQNDQAMQRPLLNNTKEEFKKIFDGRLPLV